MHFLNFSFCFVLFLYSLLLDFLFKILEYFETGNFKNETFRAYIAPSLSVLGVPTSKEIQLIIYTLPTPIFFVFPVIQINPSISTYLVWSYMYSVYLKILTDLLQTWGELETTALYIHLNLAYGLLICERPTALTVFN